MSVPVPRLHTFYAVPPDHVINRLQAVRDWPRLAPADVSVYRQIGGDL